MGSLPHARGSVSYRKAVGGLTEASSPRPWGCFCGGCAVGNGRRVFPTPVGVFLADPVLVQAVAGLPHARGGVSDAGRMLSGIWRSSPKGASRQRVSRSSPRQWGCFLYGPVRRLGDLVFPTPVGVFLSAATRAAPAVSLPHARGGVSLLLAEPAEQAASSPRPWGCFHFIPVKNADHLVFPTPVGVFLSEAASAAA